MMDVEDEVALAVRRVAEAGDTIIGRSGVRFFV